MKEESQNHRPDPELEARIVSLMLGESSELEREQLLQILDEYPELLVFKAKMDSVHELMREVAMGEFPASDEDWKLPAEKRNAVLATINPEVYPQPANTPSVRLSSKSVPFKKFNLGSLAKVAAVFCVVGFFGLLAISSFGGRAREMARNQDQVRPPVAGTFFERAEKSTEAYMSDSVSSQTLSENRYFQAETPAREEFSLNQDSKSALSAIRDKLGNERVSETSRLSNGDFGTVQPPKGSSQWLSREPITRSQPSIADVTAGTAVMPSTVPNAGPVDGSKSKVPEVALRYGRTDSEESSNALRSWGLAHNPVLAPAAVKAQDKVREQVQLGDASGGVTLSFPNSVAQSDASGTVTAQTDTSQQLQKSLRESRIDLDIPRPSAAKPSVSSDNGRDLDFAKSAPQQQSAQTTTLSNGTTNLPYPNSPMTPPTSGMSRTGQGSLTVDSNGGRQGGFGGGTIVNGGVLTVNEGDRRSIEDGRKPDTVAGEKSGDSLSRLELVMSAPLESQIQTGGTIRGVEKKTDANSVVDLFAKNSSTSSTLTPNSPIESEKRELERRAKRIDEVKARVQVEKERGIKPSDESLVDKEKQMPNKASLGRGTENDKELDALFGVDNPTGDEQAGLKDPYGSERKPSPPGTPSSSTDSKKASSPDDYAKTDSNFMTTLTPRILIEEEVVEKNEEVAQKYTDGLAYFNGTTTWYGKTAVDKKFAPHKGYIVPEGLNELNAADDAFSTFSLHVSDVSFKLALAALAQGEWLEAAKIRIEEFVNAIDYGDPLPKQGEKVACRVEQSIHPFLQQRNLLRVSMRTSAAGRDSNTPLRLTLLLDNSGSMERFDRQQTVRRAFATLAGQLKPIDQVTLISFARQPRLLADKISGAQSNQLIQLVENLPSEGGTNIEAALQLAFEKAKEQQTEGAQNRIVLLTDGAVNLGDANPDSLLRMVTTMRDAGIAFDAAGISAEGLNDEVLEALTRKGDGRYYLLDSAEAVDDGFANQIAGALRPSAKNVKVQIEFNPKRVGKYKLLGFEKHLLKQEDFRNDQVDAAEMAAAEAGVAVYQFEAKPDGEGDVGSVSVRFQDLTTGEMGENYWPIRYEPDAARTEQAAPSMRIASCAALFAAKLRGDPLGGTVDLKALSELLSGLPQQCRNGKPVQQLQLMIDQARQVSGK